MSGASRTVNSARNIGWGVIGKLTTLALSFISRTVFIYCLGTVYLGVNGLFSNVLSILAFSELGIGTAMNYSLYKPVADGNREKICSLMHAYKQAYRVVAGIIATLGLALLPWLDVFVKGADGIGDIRVYYLLFLFNTVCSYFVTYKYGLVNAEQKNYILTNIDTCCRIAVTLVQIVVMLVFHDFLVYLLVQTGTQLLQQIFTALYLNRRYSYLERGTCQPLDHETKHSLIVNIRALICHQIGSICVYQTDYILISMFISVGIVGLVSNYQMMLSAVTGFIILAMSSVVSSLGNLVATESLQKQMQIFRAYDFCGFWLYSFETISFAVLCEPFITLWIGDDKLIDSLSWALILINIYFVGQRDATFRFETAAGIFDPGKYASIVQSIINLVVSVYGVNQWGLPGIYIGTIVSGIVITVWKPYVLYSYQFKKSCLPYFARLIRNAIFVGTIIALMLVLRGWIMPVVTIPAFVLMTFLTFIIPNLVIAVTFWRTNEMQYLNERVHILLQRKLAHGK